jgi:PAS domain S-box-containing protein
MYGGDLDTIKRHWETLAAGEPTTFEIRWKNQPHSRDESKEGTEDYLWSLSACVPIKSEDGTVTGVFGCNTDISAQKEATRTTLLHSEAERRLASFIELAPVGMYHLDSNIEMRYCNDQWFRITGHPKVPISQVDWRLIVHKDDLTHVYREINVATKHRGAHTFYIRLNKPWMAPEGISSPTWILVIATTTVDNDGKMTSIIGTMTDVSQLKWAEAIQKTRVEEALESKRQQENFIDMTSHEMRNPLSAMVQCADLLSSSLGVIGVLAREDAIAAQPVLQSQLMEMVSTSSDAIETIQACATHQKHIVDDILTLSKLDSKLLVISPITLQPTVLLKDTYKMLKDEANKYCVNLSVQCDASFEDLHIDWAILDPTRVLQSMQSPRLEL